MIKYLISLIFILFLFSCNELYIDNVTGVLENSTNKIEEIIENKKQDNNEKIQINKTKTKDTIFYYVGEPYFIEGVSYTPEENYNYSEIGLSSFYGKELHNIKTVNNDLNKVTELLGRHKTLPIPSMVKVTNMENGLSINVKIVDRHDDNAVIIQVSRKVAQLLGFYKSKLATVKVEILSDASKQWKSVANSLNEANFDETISSAPTDIVAITNIDNQNDISNNKLDITQPIELSSEEISDFKLFLQVYNFNDYSEIQLIMKSFSGKYQYTSDKNNEYYDLIIGPINKIEINNLVSHFISKGYKETKIILK